MRFTAREHIAAQIAAALAPHFNGESWAENLARHARQAADAILDELAAVPCPHHCATRGCGQRIEDGHCYCPKHEPPQVRQLRHHQERLRGELAEQLRARALGEQERREHAAQPVTLTPEQARIVEACEQLTGGAVAVAGASYQTVAGEPLAVTDDDGASD